MLDTLLTEFIAIFDRWFDEISEKDAEHIVSRSPLQAGIHDYACLEYIKGRTSLSTTGTDFADFSNTKSHSQHSTLTRQQVTDIIQPRLTGMLRKRVEELRARPVLNYTITISASLEVENGTVELTLLYDVDEQKRSRLLEQINRYVEQKVKNGRYPTKPLDTFFLAYHLLDRGLFPQPDYREIMAIYEQILKLNSHNPKAQAQHRNDILNALRSWIDERFLPQFFDPPANKWSNDSYTLKPEAALMLKGAQGTVTGKENETETAQLAAGPGLVEPEPRSAGQLEPGPLETGKLEPGKLDPGQLDLLLFAAAQIIKYKPGYMRNTGLQYLECATALGSKKAVQFMKEGSGAFAREDALYKDELVECHANDIFSTITISFKKETEASYGRALDFICNLLEKGFRSSYLLKLKASHKVYLPVKGLARSGNHRFFAAAAEYPGLHPKLEQYARLAMKEFEWYGDTEGEKSCMPGSYAVFALALADSGNLPLVEEYMRLVDDEHQLVQNKFVEALVAAHGVEPEMMRTLVISLLKCPDTPALKLPAGAFETKENMEALLELANELSAYEADHLVHQIWRGSKKLKASSKKASAEVQPLMLQLLERCS